MPTFKAVQVAKEAYLIVFAGNYLKIRIIAMKIFSFCLCYAFLLTLLTQAGNAQADEIRPCKKS